MEDVYEDVRTSDVMFQDMNFELLCTRTLLSPEHIQYNMHRRFEELDLENSPKSTP